MSKFFLAWGVPHFSETPEVFTISKSTEDFSARFYIWSRALPLLKKYFWIGSGFGTFPLVFPQRDFEGKWIAFGDHSIIVEKPHNMFLQFVFDAGVFFLIGFVSLCSVLLWKIRLSRIDASNWEHAMFAPSIITYLVLGIFNNSVIFISPLFWSMMGIAFSYLRLVKDSLPQKHSPV